MANPNEYLVFEADQVLTNDHLNQMFYYLDQQNRWSRNKLIGIGIVCGLDIVQLPGIIQITKGCGVTSQGYLIIQPEVKYTYYIPYAPIDQPNDLPFTYPGDLPFYKPYGQNKTIYLLLSDDDYNQLESADQKKALTLSSATKKFLDDYVVVLFLEANEMDLKNCDTFDCNNKGEKIMLQVKALLVKKTELPGVKKGKKGTTTVIAGAAPEIKLKRFNVPYTDLKTTDDVINAFTKLVDNTILTSVSGAYRYCYDRYKGLLNETADPFVTLFSDLKAQRDSILVNFPLFIQYFYDFIDDLIKAYYEFRAKISSLISACCPDENLFPLHLILGEATASSNSFEQDAYRRYFIYSPLFARQGNEVSETIFLFRRMKILVKEFIVLPVTKQGDRDIKITPSLIEYAWLSQRAIPYYYTLNEPANELYKFWSYYKTTHGNAHFNLSYHANLYNSSDAVLQPLLYDIEPFNFFRIEGHIGINFQTALADILQQRDSNNLPFDVVAVSADQLPANTATLPECDMQDLETDYRLIVSEFACKVHVPFCTFSQAVYNPLNNKTFDDGSADKVFSSIKAEALQHFNEPMVFLKAGYVKGDFMRAYCSPKTGTVGSAYLAAIDADGNFNNPLSPDQNNPLINSYYYTFQFIDAVEELMKYLLTNNLNTLDIATLKKIYFVYLISITILTNILSFFNQQATLANDTKPAAWLLDYGLDLLLVEFGILTSMCIDDRLQTLKNEYIRRLQLYELQRSFLYYFRKHHGLEHKAGVPKGGTFVLVYHTIQNSLTGTTAFVPGTSFINRAAATQPFLIDDNTISIFRSFVDDCKDAPPEKRKILIDILTNLEPAPPAKFQVPNNVVIADFYVPYLCCSDCSPIAYVLPPNLPEAQFEIQPEFLFDDAHNYPFTISPLVEDVTAIGNPGALDLLIEDKKLYLHPAMGISATLKTTLSYQGITIPVTIIKPDATFTITITNDTAGNMTVQLEAKNKDGDSYEWTANDNDLPQDSAKQPLITIGLAKLKSIVGDAKEIIIELTISYTRNDHTTTDVQQQNLIAEVCVDFESPLVKDTIYGGQAGQKSGDTAFQTDKGVIVKVFDFLSVTGSKAFQFAKIDATGRLGTGQSLQINNISVEFDYSKIGFQPSVVTFAYLDQGGQENFSVNGGKIFIGELAVTPAIMDGISITVTPAPGGNARSGTVTMKGPVKTFRIGGQEFWMDTVCAYL